jgi:hypothetical protein
MSLLLSKQSVYTEDLAYQQIAPSQWRLVLSPSHVAKELVMPTDLASQLHDATLTLFHQTIARFPPTHAPAPHIMAPDRPGRLGDYLIQLGYLTPRQLTRALHDAAAADRRNAPLGCTLVAHDLVPPQVVAVVLLQQFLDRLAIDDRQAPRFLGEQLLFEARLEPAQLTVVLREQMESYQHGTWVRLGNLIVQHGWLEPLTISTAVEHMRRPATI